MHDALSFIFIFLFFMNAESGEDGIIPNNRQYRVAFVWAGGTWWAVPARCVSRDPCSSVLGWAGAVERLPVKSPIQTDPRAAQWRTVWALETWNPVTETQLLKAAGDQRKTGHCSISTGRAGAPLSVWSSGSDRVHTGTGVSEDNQCCYSSYVLTCHTEFAGNVSQRHLKSSDEWEKMREMREIQSVSESNQYIQTVQVSIARRQVHNLRTAFVKQSNMTLEHLHWQINLHWLILKYISVLLFWLKMHNSNVFSKHVCKNYLNILIELWPNR